MSISARKPASHPDENSNKNNQIDDFLVQHLSLASSEIQTPHGSAKVTIDEAESPLAWLARRKGRDGRPLIDIYQFAAGERLRSEFTRANMTPRVTSNWEAAVSTGARSAGSGAAHITEVVIASRQRFRHALNAVGPEFAGLLVDVCCFLKRLDEVERERQWPARSAKVVLQLGLDRLARHFGLTRAAHGKTRPDIITWLAPDAAFTADALETE
jgi:hypothetical protein